MEKIGTKDDSGKLRYDLIPVMPLRELAKTYTIGAKKYEDNNWRKGIKFSRIVAALKRHLELWLTGEDYDVDGQHHLAAVAWNAFTLMWYSVHRKEFDDRADIEKQNGPVEEPKSSRFDEPLCSVANELAGVQSGSDPASQYRKSLLSSMNIKSIGSNDGILKDWKYADTDQPLSPVQRLEAYLNSKPEVKSSLVDAEDFPF